MWQESSEEDLYTIPEDVLDLSFNIECRALPLDHAHALAEAIQQVLPWFAEEPEAGLHLIHGAESGNGWYRPDSDNDLLYLSRRTRLMLRLPAHRVADAEALSAQILDIQGHALKVGKPSRKPFIQTSILFARYVQADPQQSEEDFIAWALEELRAMRIQCRKLLPGRSRRFQTPQGELFARSLLLADLRSEDAVLLQQKGLGAGRKMGFGLFVPHKDIKPVSSGQNAAK